MKSWERIPMSRGFKSCPEMFWSPLGVFKDLSYNDTMLRKVFNRASKPANGYCRHNTPTPPPPVIRPPPPPPHTHTGTPKRQQNDMTCQVFT